MIDQDARAYDGPNRREARFRLAGMYVVDETPSPQPAPGTIVCALVFRLAPRCTMLLYYSYCTNS